MSPVTHLYQELLREANRLPHLYLRQFYLFRYQHSFRDLLKSPEHSKTLASKLKTFNRELSTLRSANEGHKARFQRVLAQAYGRIGKLKWELLEPILTDPEQSPRRLIPNMPRSQLPVYHPLLTGLLTSSISRRTSPVKPNSLINPPTLPERAIDKDCDEARLLGPFSKRREANIRRKYFHKQANVVYPPLEVGQTVSEMDKSASCDHLATQGFQHGAVEQIERLTGSARNFTIPRRERRLFETRNSVVHKSSQAPKVGLGDQLPTRWLRRRYRELLHTVPIVSEVVGRTNRKVFDISLSSRALGEASKGTPLRAGVAKPLDLEWIKRASEMETDSKRNEKRK